MKIKAIIPPNWVGSHPRLKVQKKFGSVSLFARQNHFEKMTRNKTFPFQVENEHVE